MDESLTAVAREFVLVYLEDEYNGEGLQDRNGSEDERCPITGMRSTFTARTL